MAINILDNGSYAFTPSTNTIVINRWLPPEDLIRIVNATSGGVLYDPTSFETKASSYIASSSLRTTTIVLFKNCATMSSTDDLQIYADDSTSVTSYGEVAQDPIDRSRVSLSQSLIDTDFEYGLQQGKWENLGMTNNRPYSYGSPTVVPTITDIAPTTAGSRSVTITGGLGHGVSTGDVISVQDTYMSQANGVFTVDSTTIGTIVYTARAAFPNTTSIYDSSKTVVYKGSYYTGSLIPGTHSISSTNLTTAGAIVTITTAVPHNLSIGNEIEVDSITGTNAPKGSFVVSKVTSPTVFSYFVYAQPGTITGNPLVYSRSQGLVVHRPFDGGVQFSANAASNYESQIRQTRRYFRYQSGKGMQMAAGIVIKPNLSIDSISLEDSPKGIIINTKDQHNMQPGTFITIANANIVATGGASPNFDPNGTWQVTAIFGANQLFLFRGVDGDYNYSRMNDKTFADESVTGEFQVTVASWYGAANKIGMFDQQNGPFWDFDGQTLSIVRRYSTYQIAGRVNVTNNSNTVTGSSTPFVPKFNSQLKPGDYIVIRGSSYRIDSIASDTSLTISPSYRGPSSNNVTITKTNELRIPQSSFNLDKLDGTGPSGYNIDLSKMQMFYIDFSWYGAGSIRWGVRDTNGKIIYAHKMANNNVNYEAYMRSGNVPARYETVTNPPKTYSIDGLASGSTATLNVASTTGFPSTGTLVIKGQSVTEFVNYTGLTTTSFTGLTRGQAGSLGLTATSTVQPSALYGSFEVSDIAGLQVGQRIVARPATATCAYPDNTYITKIVAGTGTTGIITTSQLLTGSAGTTALTAIPMGTTAAAIAASATAPIAVELAYPSYSPTLSHWGTSVLMEGRYDDDKSALVVYPQTATSLIPPTTVSVSTAASGNASTTITLSTAAPNLKVGQVLTSTTTGSLTTTSPTYITAVASSTSFTINQAPTGALVSGTVVLTTPSYALFSVRVSPSVDNGIPTNFGVRELINRMQIILRSLNITSLAAGNLYVSLVLNSKSSAATTWSTTPVTTNSLAQIAPHVPTPYTFGSGVYPGAWTGTGLAPVHTIGGDVIGGWYVSGTSQTFDLNQLPSLSNSILGGGSTTSDLQFFPDGPDIVTVVVKNMSTSTAADVAASLSWTEAQA